MIRPLGKTRVTNTAEAVCDDCGMSQTETCRYSRVHSKLWEPDEGQVINRLTTAGWSLIRKRLRCPKCERLRRAPPVGHTARPEPKVAAALRLTIPDSPLSVVLAHKPVPAPFPTPAPLIIEPAQNAPQEPAMSSLAQLSQVIPAPSRDQRRLIMAALTDAYDVKAERYAGSHTDKTLAESIGRGVRAGWVAEVREEFFGSDAGNSEMDDLRAALVALKAEIATLTAEGKAAVELANQIGMGIAECGAKHGKLMERFDAVRHAVGPKAGAK